MEALKDSNKRVRDDSPDSEFDSPDVKRIREDLLGSLDDSDSIADPELDLDDVMRSFEEEIGASPTPVQVVDLTSDSREAQPQLGYLLEASDDELGLPPSVTSREDLKDELPDLERVTSDSSVISDLWRFDDEFHSYDSLDFGICDNNHSNISNGEFVALDGLFDYSDVGLEASDFSDFSWRPETLPAL